MKIWHKLAAALSIVSAGAYADDAKPPEHAVIVQFRYGSTNLEPLFELEDRLENAIAAAGAGEYDGNEMAVDGEHGVLYMYGPDADRLYEADIHGGRKDQEALWAGGGRRQRSRIPAVRFRCHRSCANSGLGGMQPGSSASSSRHLTFLSTRGCVMTFSADCPSSAPIEECS